MVKLGDWLSEGWKMFSANIATWIVSFLIVAVVIGVIQGILWSVLFAGMLAGGAMGLFLYPVMMGIQSVVPAILFGVAAVPLSRMALRQVRGETPEIGDVFKLEGATDGLVAGLIVGLICAVATVLCIIPVWFVSPLFMFTYFLIADKNLKSTDAIAASVQTVRKAYWPLLGTWIVYGIIAGAGLIGLGIGVLVTCPLVFLALAAAYRDLVMGERAAAAPGPQA